MSKKFPVDKKSPAGYLNREEGKLSRRGFIGTSSALLVAGTALTGAEAAQAGGSKGAGAAAGAAPAYGHPPA